MKLILLAQPAIIDPNDMTQVRHSQRTDGIEDTDNFHWLCIARYNRVLIALAFLELLPPFSPCKILIKHPGIDVCRVQLDELAHGRRPQDSDFPHESGTRSRCKSASGEAEKVELVAWGVVIDNEVEAFNNVFN